MGNWKTLGTLGLLVSALAASGQERPKIIERTVSARLSFSVEEYDPTKKSHATMKCVVKNDSGLGTHVPVGYDDGYIRLQSGTLTLHKRTREKEDVKLVWVAPGQQQVVFELPLDEIFLMAEKRDNPWSWDWPRRPEPPKSPIHKYRAPGFVEQAPFTVSLNLGASTLTSKATTLKVKSGGGN